MLAQAYWSAMALQLRSAVGLAGALLGVALGLAACGGGAPAAAAGATPTASGAGQSAGIGFSGVYPAGSRHLAPALSGPLLGGGYLNLASLRGHAVLVNFWASWCGPCQAETPTLERLSRELAPLGVRFVGVDVADSDGAALAFRARDQVSYPSLVDHAGQLLARFPGVPPSALPSSVLIDPQGRIAATWVGPVQAAGLARALRAIAGAA